jgi:predicted GIY-YIG superfamily endonuclease
MGTYSLYRHYFEDVLLYIGITNNPARRTSEHARTKKWWHFCTRTEWSRKIANTFSEAERIETAAIEAEKPLFNIKHNKVMADKVRRYMEYLAVGRPKQLLPPVPTEERELVSAMSPRRLAAYQRDPARKRGFLILQRNELEAERRQKLKGLKGAYEDYALEGWDEVAPELLPPGRYATDGPAGTRFFHYRVKAAHGKRPVEVKGAPGELARIPVTDWEAQRFLVSVLSAGIGASRDRYGVELGACAECDSPLTNELSRGRGYGPDCWYKR